MFTAELLVRDWTRGKSPDRLLEIVAPIRGEFYVAYGVLTLPTPRRKRLVRDDPVRSLSRYHALAPQRLLWHYNDEYSANLRQYCHRRWRPGWIAHRAVADRFQNHLMPFFSKNLCSSVSCQ